MLHNVLEYVCMGVFTFTHKPYYSLIEKQTYTLRINMFPPDSEAEIYKYLRLLEKFIK